MWSALSGAETLSQQAEPGYFARLLSETKLAIVQTEREIEQVHGHGRPACL